MKMTKKGTTVIVRSRDQGVMYGTFIKRKKDVVYLKEARQMWRWHSAVGGTLVDCAQFGVEPEECKFSVGKADTEIINVCGILKCTKKAVKTFEAVTASPDGS